MLFTAKSFKKNQFLIEGGENVKEAYFVLSGLLKLNYTDDSGKVHIVSFAMAKRVASVMEFVWKTLG